MDSRWQDLLSRADPRFADEGEAGFGDPAAQARAVSEETVVAPLPECGALRVTGPDAVQLLQGQLTADVAGLGEARSRPAAWCTPKGRMIVCGRLVPEAGGLLYLIPAAQVAACKQRLSMYVFRSQVELSDISDTLLVAGLSGPAAARWCADSLGLALPEPDAVSRDAETALVGLAGEGRALLLAPEERMAGLLPGLVRVARPVSAPAWRLLDVRAGRPWLPPELSETFLPQMLNLDQMHGVSFDKGCYAGQEIVARTQYLGRLKRRLFVARVAHETAPVPGDPLYASADAGSGPVQGEHVAGTVVGAALDVDGRWAMLAVVNIADAAGGSLRLHHVLGPPVELQDPPSGPAADTA